MGLKYLGRRELNARMSMTSKVTQQGQAAQEPGRHHGGQEAQRGKEAPGAGRHHGDQKARREEEAQGARIEGEAAPPVLTLAIYRTRVWNDYKGWKIE